MLALGLLWMLFGTCPIPGIIEVITHYFQKIRYAQHSLHTCWIHFLGVSKFLRLRLCRWCDDRETKKVSLEHKSFIKGNVDEEDKLVLSLTGTAFD